MSEIDVLGGPISMTTFGPEIVPFTIDLSDPIADAGGTSASATTSTMIDHRTKEVVALADAPTMVTTTVIQQIVRTAVLEAQKRYDVYVSYTVNGAPSTTELTVHFQIKVDV